jgi:RNase P protein component
MDQESQREANVSAEQPEAGEAPRVPAPHADAGRSSRDQEPPAQGPASAVGLITGVHTRAAFDALRRSANRGRSGPLRVIFVPGDRFGLAFAIPRRAGTSVARHRLRRPLRAACRELVIHSGQDGARTLAPPNGNYLISVHAETLGMYEARELTFDSLRNWLAQAIDHATRRNTGSCGATR